MPDVIVKLWPGKSEQQKHRLADAITEGEVGSAVERLKPGQYVIGSIFASDGTCPHYRAAASMTPVDRRRSLRRPSGDERRARSALRRKTA